MKEDRPLGLRSGAEFAAAVRELVNKCRESTSPKELLESCESLFRLLRDKKIELEVPYIPSDLLQQQQQQESKPGFTQWLQQSFHVFVSIVFELLESSEAPLQKLGLSYLFRILKHESEVHKSSTFPLAAFQVFASRLLQANAFPGYLQDLLLKEYLHKYLDVRYYMLVVILKILREFVAEKNQQHNAAAAAAAEGGQHEAAGNEWFRWKRGERDLSSRLTSLLLQISDIIAAGPRGRRRRGPPGDPPGGPPGGPGGPPGAPKDSDSEASESEDEKKWMEEEEAAAAATWIKGLAAAKAVEPGSHRLVFQNAWLLLLLQVQHSKALLQQLLAAVPRRVLPLLSNPLLLSDFFLKAFAESSHLSLRISALSGLFYLLTKHRLGNPELLSAAAAAAAAADQEAAAGAHLYQQLYRLLTPAALSPRLRGRFLRLLNLALRSDLLPACLVAAFIKKCCRVACVAAPAAALCLQAFAASLLQKYSTICKPLLLLPPHVAASLRVSGDSFDYSKCEVRRARGAPRGPLGGPEGAPSWGVPSGGAPGGPPGDPLASSEDEEEAPGEAGDEKSALCKLVKNCLPKSLEIRKEEVLPLARRQAKMSLWEVELLNKHAVVSVQQMGSLFLTDFTNPAARKVQLEDFLDITTGSLLSRELKAINKPSSEITLANFAGNPTKVPIPVDVPNLHAASMNIAKLCSC